MSSPHEFKYLNKIVTESPQASVRLGDSGQVPCKQLRDPPPCTTITLWSGVTPQMYTLKTPQLSLVHSGYTFLSLHPQALPGLRVTDCALTIQANRLPVPYGTWDPGSCTQSPAHTPRTFSTAAQLPPEAPCPGAALLGHQQPLCSGPISVTAVLAEGSGRVHIPFSAFS